MWFRLSKCPYCKEELDLKLEIFPAPINEKFRSDFLVTYENFIDIQAEVVPFGGKMMKRMAKIGIKFISRYLDQIGAIPVIVHSCAKCDSVITTESMIDLMSSRGSGSS